MPRSGPSRGRRLLCQEPAQARVVWLIRLFVGWVVSAWWAGCFVVARCVKGGKRQRENANSGSIERALWVYANTLLADTQLYMQGSESRARSSCLPCTSLRGQSNRARTQRSHTHRCLTISRGFVLDAAGCGFLSVGICTRVNSSMDVNATDNAIILITIEARHVSVYISAWYILVCTGPGLRRGRLPRGHLLHQDPARVRWLTGRLELGGYVDSFVCLVRCSCLVHWLLMRWLVVASRV
jgi:hypothetical protein